MTNLAITSHQTTYNLELLVFFISMLLCVGVYPVPEEAALDAWAPSRAPISANEPVGAGAHSSADLHSPNYTVLHYGVLYRPVLYCTLPYCTVPCGTVSYITF